MWVFSFGGSCVYHGLVSQYISRGVCCIGKEVSVVLIYISNSHSNRKRVLAIGYMAQAW